MNEHLFDPATPAPNKERPFLPRINDGGILGRLGEALGHGTLPVIAVPCLKMDLVRHPSFSKSIALLRECGVHVLHEPERYPSPLMVPWSEVIGALHGIDQESGRRP